MKISIYSKKKNTMTLQNIDYENIDEIFRQTLNRKPDRNNVKGIVNIEHISLNKKSQFVFEILSSFNVLSECTYRILFWERNDVIEDFFKLNFPKKEHVVYIPYQDKKLPGICIVHDIKIDEFFFKSLINNHFNFELAKEPSLCIRVQMCIHITGFKIFIDIYDDRGLYIYWQRQVK